MVVAVGYAFFKTSAVSAGEAHGGQRGWPLAGLRGLRQEEVSNGSRGEKPRGRMNMSKKKTPRPKVERAVRLSLWEYAPVQLKVGRDRPAAECFLF